MDEKEQITLNSLQHYIFCPYSWSLIFGHGEWAENYRTVSGHIFHERVHDDTFDEKRSDKYSVRGMPLYNGEYNLCGIADLIEFIPDEKDGIFIKSINKKCRPVAVEYKVGRPADNVLREADAVQLASQMLCLEYMFQCKVEGYVYYKGINKRLKLLNYQETKAVLLNAIKEIDHFNATKIFPSQQSKQGCHSCSLVDICMPKHKCGDIKTIMNNEWEKLKI